MEDEKHSCNLIKNCLSICISRIHCIEDASSPYCSLTGRLPYPTNLLQGKALQELKAKIQLLEGDLTAQSLGITAAVAEKDANFSLLQEALQRAEVRRPAILSSSIHSKRWSFSNVLFPALREDAVVKKISLDLDEGHLLSL